MRALVLCLVLLTAACAQGIDRTKWGGAPADSDLAYCELEAKKAATPYSTAGGIFAPAIYNSHLRDAFELCMRSRGYYPLR